MLFAPRAQKEALGHNVYRICNTQSSETITSQDPIDLRSPFSAWRFSPKMALLWAMVRWVWVPYVHRCFKLQVYILSGNQVVRKPQNIWAYPFSARPWHRAFSHTTYIYYIVRVEMFFTFAFWAPVWGLRCAQAELTYLGVQSNMTRISYWVICRNRARFARGKTIMGAQNQTYPKA